jgi:hypothetical protein
MNNYFIHIQKKYFEICSTADSSKTLFIPKCGLEIPSHMNVTFALLGFSASGFRNQEINVVAKLKCVAKQHIS